MTVTEAPTPIETLSKGLDYLEHYGHVCTVARAALEDVEALVVALLAARKARLATDNRQRECVKQAHGDSHMRCGKCFLCLERTALAKFQVEP